MLFHFATARRQRIRKRPVYKERENVTGQALEQLQQGCSPNGSRHCQLLHQGHKARRAGQQEPGPGAKCAGHDAVGGPQLDVGQ